MAFIKIYTIKVPVWTRYKSAEIANQFGDNFLSRTHIEASELWITFYIH